MNVIPSVVDRISGRNERSSVPPSYQSVFEPRPPPSGVVFYFFCFLLYRPPRSTKIMIRNENTMCNSGLRTRFCGLCAIGDVSPLLLDGVLSSYLALSFSVEFALVRRTPQNKLYFFWIHPPTNAHPLNQLKHVRTCTIK